MDHPRPGLRYVDADDLDDSAFDFDGLDVESNDGEKLGDVDGFVIDVNSARPYYVVVNAGGWFTSKYFLLPVGHVALDAERRRLVADVSRDRVARYPGFDRDEFEQLSDADLNRMDEQMLSACCPNETIDRSYGAQQRYDRWTHYQSPSWWDASYYRPDRADRSARAMTSMGTAAAAGAAPDIDVRREQREAVVAREGDVSPHMGGRAQPGDVLGVETGGEQTHVGETSEDEDKRRVDAEKAARKR